MIWSSHTVEKDRIDLVEVLAEVLYPDRNPAIAARARERARLILERITGIPTPELVPGADLTS